MVVNIRFLIFITLILLFIPSFCFIVKSVLEVFDKILKNEELKKILLLNRKNMILKFKEILCN